MFGVNRLFVQATHVVPSNYISLIQRSWEERWDLRFNFHKNPLRVSKIRCKNHLSVITLADCLYNSVFYYYTMMNGNVNVIYCFKLLLPMATSKFTDGGLHVTAILVPERSLISTNVHAQNTQSVTKKSCAQ